MSTLKSINRMVGLKINVIDPLFSLLSWIDDPKDITHLLNKLYHGPLKLCTIDNNCESYKYRIIKQRLR